MIKGMLRWFFHVGKMNEIGLQRVRVKAKSDRSVCEGRAHRTYFDQIRKKNEFGFYEVLTTNGNV